MQKKGKEQKIAEPSTRKSNATMGAAACSDTSTATSAKSLATSM
jgi:hypothetical protein